MTRTFLGATLATLLMAGTAMAADLNALVWCDHSDPNLLKPFEDANGIKVNVKEFEGTGAGLAIVERSQPGDWDVMVIDSIDIRRGVERGLFEALPEDKLPMADLFPEVTMDAYTKVDGVRYGVTEKFGYNTISYNRAKVDAADMESLSALAYDKYKGRIAIYDYYLPVIGLVAMSLGKKTAELTEADLPAIKEVLLKMKANAKAVTDVVSSQTVLATGEADVLIALERAGHEVMVLPERYSDSMGHAGAVAGQQFQDRACPVFRVAGAIGTLAAVAVVDRQLAFQDIGEQRHAMPVDDGRFTGRQRDDGGGDVRLACGGIGDVLAHDGLAAGQQRDGGIALGEAGGGRRRQHGGGQSESGFHGVRLQERVDDPVDLRHRDASRNHTIERNRPRPAREDKQQHRRPDEMLRPGFRVDEDLDDESHGEKRQRRKARGKPQNEQDGAGEFDGRGELCGEFGR